MLTEGDIIVIEKGMTVYAMVPKHFVYSNCLGDFSLTHHNVEIDDTVSYLTGKYIVTKTCMDGGGMDQSGPYPNGHHVFCTKVENENIKVDFYQSGCFTAMIESIKPIGKAKIKFVIE